MTPLDLVIWSLAAAVGMFFVGTALALVIAMIRHL